MDLLHLPQDPSFAANKAPYVCEERYDGGPFLTYAHRKDKTGTLQPGMENKSPSTGLGLRIPSPVAYQEMLHPRPQEEQEQFYQTWFFFGLLAEFLSLNTQEDGTYLIDSSVAQIELEGLYTDYVFTENEKVYVRALKIMGCAPLIVGRIGQGKVSVRARLSHLSECLRFTCVMLNSIHSEFDDNIKYSIAALGELFSNVINTLRSIWKIDIPLLGYPWAKGFLRSEGEIEAKMIDAGWCLSDIERARFAYTGLNTVHLLSRLKRPLPLRKHDKCTRDRCEAFQIDLKSYTLSHSQAGCSCSEIGVDIQAVLSILNGTDSYPVLSITVPEQGYNGVKISVEKHRQDLPYVALSHVSTSWYFKGRMFLDYMTGLGRWTWQPRTEFFTMLSDRQTCRSRYQTPRDH